MDAPRLWLDDRHDTVAERLADRGYATACFSANPWIGKKWNLTQGFAVQRSPKFMQRLSRVSIEYALERWGVTPRLPWFDNDYGAALSNYLVSEWLNEEGQRGRPVFVFINYMEAHLPYRVPRAFRAAFMDEEQIHRSYDLRWHVYGEIANVLGDRYNVGGSDFMPQADRDVLRRQYDAAIRYLDGRVEELIELFERRGLLEDTLVIVSSDHGEYLDTHGMWGHDYLTYDDLTHVALLLREPGRRQGVRVSSPVQPSDLYDTVLDFTGGTSHAESTGPTRDLLEIAAAGDAARLAFSEYNRSPARFGRPEELELPVGDLRGVPQVAVQDGRFKLIESADGRRELYDLPADPAESRNVIDLLPEVGERLADALCAWREAVPPYSSPDDDPKHSVDPHTLDVLRELGYVGAGGQ
jgi:arylsulfatase A-like enzyme